MAAGSAGAGRPESVSFVQPSGATRMKECDNACGEQIAPKGMKDRGD
jgi:hypothetical protein